MRSANIGCVGVGYTFAVAMTIARFSCAANREMRVLLAPGP